KEVTHADLTELKGFGGWGKEPPGLNGPIGLLSHSREVKFRKLEVKDLSEPFPAPGFKALFNGHNYADDWEVAFGPSSLWTVNAATGELITRGTGRPADHGFLATKREYADFVLRCDFQLAKGAVSGV